MPTLELPSEAPPSAAKAVLVHGTPATQLVGGAVFVVGASLGMASAWGFSVDDALISTRVAGHLAQGLGHRFNPQGPIVDCVTPFGWQWLLSLFAGADSWQTFLVARWISALCWLGAAALIGWQCARWLSGWALVGIAATLTACLPLGAWASAGMETGLVALLCSVAMLGLYQQSRRPVVSPSCLTTGSAALAAGLRPELLLWAVTVCAGGSLLTPRRRPGRALLGVCLAAVPFAVVCTLRLRMFGHAPPLSAWAKPPDFAFGLRYAVGGALLSGPLWLLAGRGIWKLAPVPTRVLILGLAAHGVSLTLVGGDWMALFRLWVPVLPSAFLIVASQSMHLGRRLWLRCGLSFAAAGVLHAGMGSATRRVIADRRQLIDDARPSLDGVVRVASVDVGWLGVYPRLEIVDLAGATDAPVALRPGGHTSKRLASDFLWRRDVDALVLLSAPQAPTPDESRGRLLTWSGFHFARQVEQRLQQLDAAKDYYHRASMPFGQQQRYEVFQRAPRAAQATLNQPSIERERLRDAVSRRGLP